MTNFNVMRGFNSNENLENNLERELELMLEEHRRSLNMIIDRERDLNIYRSGSAPPTVEGALSAVGSLLRNPNFAEFDSSSIISGSGMLTEEEIRSHPAYSSYYYSHDNLNPRLPPPLLSKEDWRVAQRLHAAGSSFEGIGDLRKKNLGDIGGGSSLFSTQPQLSAQKAGNELMELRKVSERNLLMKNTSEWMKSDHTGLVGSFGSGMGVRRKSFADILQEGRDQPPMLANSLSRSVSRNAYSDTANMSGISNSRSSDTHNKAESTENLNSGTPDHGLSRAQNMRSAFNNSFYSPVGSSVTRNGINEGHLSRRVPSPSLPPISSMYSVGKNISSQSALDGISPSMTEIGDVVAPLSRLTLSKDQLHDEDSLSQSQFQTGFGKLSKHLLDISDSRVHNLQRYANHADLGREEDFVADIDISNVGLDGKVSFPIRASSSSNVHLKFNSSGFGPNIMYQNNDFLGVDFPMCGSSGYSSNQKLNIASLSSGSSGNGQSLGRNASQAGSSLHSSAMGCAYVRSAQNFPDYATHATPSPCEPSCGRNYFEISPGHGDFQTLEKAYHEALFSQQNKRYQPQFLDKVGGLNHQYNMNSAFGLGVQQQRKPVVFSGVGCGSPFFQNGRASPYTSIGGSTGINMERRFVSPLLEELKGSRAASLELSDIVGHVVEFSKDQYGSRFIQQKLETATAEGKAKIFQEIVAHARGLMTDVFGNYVIQKFFEHGTENQIQELANQLIGYVLPLSHQLYGCRVIQKALEVVGVNQQTQMVTELDGSILKCVRDQNGNHVIQKCIECVPQDRIQFILSAFFGQVVPLSMHPYGCRVIQRVLEHCDDTNTQQTIMGEIMQSVCTLAQDQYGNYVIQHILQHGRAHERSGIIIKLAGQIVKLSQHKFASNVVEKCLTFGGPEECQLLINEILGSTDENEPLQDMMKDPFGNFVVQKVLETCDDQSRELVISRIKVHLNTLKRYTYGKHIVSRVEKLISAGEKCIGSAPSNSSLHSPIF